MTSSQSSWNGSNAQEISEHELQSLSAEEQDFLLRRLKDEQSETSVDEPAGVLQTVPKAD